jgi:hypothetical protein
MKAGELTPDQPISWQKIASLTMSAVSSTIRAHFSEHSEKSAISLSWMVCFFQPRLASNLSGQELSPTHASLRSATADHDYYFELLFSRRGAGCPINYSVFDGTPWRFPGCPACEPNLVNCS